MDAVKAKKNFEELASKRNTLAAEIQDVQGKIEDKRAQIGAAVLDDPTNADKLQADIAKLETRAAQLQAAAIELAKRQDAAAIELAQAKHDADAKRAKDLSDTLVTDTKKMLDQFANMRAALMQCEAARAELELIHRAYGGEFAVNTDLLNFGYKQFADRIEVDLQGYAPFLRQVK